MEEYRELISEMEDVDGILFYKIGRSFNVEKRLATFLNSLKPKLLAIITDSHEFIFETERQLLDNLKTQGYSYKPKVEFKGKGECFIINQEVVDSFKKQERRLRNSIVLR